MLSTSMKGWSVVVLHMMVGVVPDQPLSAEVQTGVAAACGHGETNKGRDAQLVTWAGSLVGAVNVLGYWCWCAIAQVPVLMYTDAGRLWDPWPACSLSVHLAVGCTGH